MCLHPRLWQVAMATRVYPVCHCLPAANGTHLWGWGGSKLPHPPGRVWTWGDGQGKVGETQEGPGRRDAVPDLLWDGMSGMELPSGGTRPWFRIHSLEPVILALGPPKGL